MFTLKLLNSSTISSRYTCRYVTSGSQKLLGLFGKKEKEPEPAENALEMFDADQNEIDSELKKERIQAIRNKSRLNDNHRRLLLGEVPYQNAQSWVHNTLKYKRKLYGKLGEKSGLDPRICFWTHTEIEDKNEYERTAYPKTVQEMIQISEQDKKETKEKELKRDEDIARNLEKLEMWKTDIVKRKEKRENDARVAKERKDRLIEEVRRHFGYTIDIRDERFKQMLEEKQKQQRKAMKESKRQEKESKLLEKLKSVKAEDKLSTEPSENSDESDPSEEKDEDVNQNTEEENVKK
ncbi:CLUMA_CG000821, isoform A [Clunio marinus]|uniref:Large ribosomal subunit protein mL64 n=1 Tax=Clunio marinus TaxID=568069 RepID=A0A1J1HKY3_9DIPT|nr:CLUMA_CG000821, isoform A [Clunio marinus]